MCIVQGMRPGRADWSGIAPGHFGHMLGNSMSVNVLERLLPRVLLAAGLLSVLPEDKWQKYGRKVKWLRNRFKAGLAKHSGWSRVERRMSGGCAVLHVSRSPGCGRGRRDDVGEGGSRTTDAVSFCRAELESMRGTGCEECNTLAHRREELSAGAVRSADMEA
jgi:hypothetical protein